MKQNLKTRSGNRIVVMFDGVAVGLCRSVRSSDDYSPEPASGIGDIHVQEYVPTQARHSVSVQKMILNNETLRSLGIFPENGDEVLKGNVFDIVKMDKDSGEVLRTYVSCSYASGDIDVSAHQIVMGSGQFNALDVRGKGM